MTTDTAAAPIEIVEGPADDLSSSTRMRIFAYLGVLILLLGFGAPGGGLIGVPISFFLKNRLHLQAHQAALFTLVAAVPVYFSFLFGFARDQWSPFGMKDRGYMVLFGSICAALYVVFAFVPLSYLTLMLAVLMVRISFLFVSSAQNGLTSTIGQQHVMSGQVSAAWNIFGSFPTIAALLAGGVLSDMLEKGDAARATRILFLTGAAIMAAVAFFGLWKPASVFGNLRDERATSAHPFADLKRLSRHWPIYPALLIWLLWSFAPGSATPLQYYLQNTLHASDANWGQWNAIFSASFIPTFLIFGLLCRKYPLRTLLFWGTVIGIPQMIPLLFIHSVAGALIVAAPIGLMGGIATAAYLDLIIRSCPRGLQGTMLMMSTAVYEVAVRFGDVLGTNLYDHYGNFGVCVIAITVVYALILPVLLLIPKPLIATPDGTVSLYV